ncbi:MAG: zinc ABC transporter substrate-binding protein [Pseudomonadales bacterium]|nr:zinc ABC transporter substrate-binding protein [Pseudomonadales bacterium]
MLAIMYRVNFLTSQCLKLGLAIMLLLPQLLVAQESTLLFSIKPLAMLYQSLAIEGSPRPEVLFKQNKNPHDYQLSVNDIQRVQQAQAFYWLGTEANLQKLSQRLKNQHWHQLNGLHEHAWLDKKGIDALVAQLSDMMQKNAPANAGHIQQKQTSFSRQIHGRFAYWQKQFKPFAETPILLGHSAFATFAKDMGLHHVEIYRSGHSHGHKASGMHDLLDLQKEIAEGHIRCAFAEPDISFEKLQRRYPALKVAMLDPMAQNMDMTANAFIHYIDANAATMHQCLKGEL